MKKSLCVCAAGMVGLGCFSSVFAEETNDVKLEFVAEYEDAEWIDNTDLLRVDKEDGYGIMDISGNMISDSVYGSELAGKYSYIVANEPEAEDVNGIGLLTREGNVIIPLEYADVDVISNGFAAAIKVTASDGEQYDYESWFSDDHWIIDTVDIYYIPENRIIATLDRSSFKDAAASDSVVMIESRKDGVVNVYDKEYNEIAADIGSIYDDEYISDYVQYREDGKTGLKDRDGNVVMQPTFNYLNTEYRGVYSAGENNKYALIKTDGTVIVPAEYDKFKGGYYLDYSTEDDNTNGYISHGYICAEKDGKLVFLDSEGNVTADTGYAVSAADTYGMSAMLTDMSGNKLLVAGDGVETTVEGYESVYCMEYTGGMYFKVTDKDYNTGVINWHGEVVVPCTASGVSVSGNGKYIMVEAEYGAPVQIYSLVYPDAAEEEAEEASEEVSAEAETPAETTAEAEEVSEASSAAE